VRAATILIVLTTLATLGNAHADEPPSPAEALYDQGQAAYAREDYTTAIEKWRASYTLSGEHELLFNLAQAYRLTGDCTRAIVMYKRFIAVDPTANQRPLAEDFSRELERTCVKQPVIDPPPRPQAPNLVDGLTGPEDRGAHPDAHPGQPLRIAGLVTGGTGLAVLATGLIFGHHASAIGTEITDACTTSCDWTVQKIKDADGRRDLKISYALDVVGVVAIASGAVMYYLGSKNVITIVPASREGGAIASWSGSW
jgi:tetratricopeptide (TPR) repeat protein